jgi:rhodanese-related sulfurtransferase
MSALPPVPPLRSIRFDPELDCSPYELYRRLREGDPPALVDLRETPMETIRGARAVVAAEVAAWRRDAVGEEGVILLDDDGARARETARALRRRGVVGVRALFGGLRLYDHALDPRVVGTDRYLVAPPGE